MSRVSREILRIDTKPPARLVCSHIKTARKSIFYRYFVRIKSLFERSKEWNLNIFDVSDLPEYMRFSSYTCTIMDLSQKEDRK